ncbi:MAG: hypothetical protein J2P25_13535 [Nocardiopsaceae bacterium]|nr:hypothetical protein [Nocardiopsaceae bacterium]
MDVWSIALISACSALAGSVITGWFTRSAGARQAEAARYAGSRQADALLATVRMQLGEQRAERVRDSRRRVYLDFIAAVDAVIVAGRTGRASEGPGDGPRDSRTTLRRALGAVQLEGPAETTQAAEYLLECLRGGTGHSPDDQEGARQAFIDAARNALASVE